MLILPLLLQAVTPAPAPAPVNVPANVPPPQTPPAGSSLLSPAETRALACQDMVADDPDAAIAEAQSWIAANGGAFALQCLGSAHFAKGSYADAARAFADAARTTGAHDPASLWMQAGNAALAAGDAAGARGHFDAALALGHLSGRALGEAHLDRARAALALGDMAAGRADLDAAIAQNSRTDPLVWLLSATLARRQGDLARAANDIAQAAVLSPQNPDIALETGNIAAARNDVPAALRAWQEASNWGGAGHAASVARAHILEAEAIARDAAGATAPAAPAAATPPQLR